MCLRFWCLSGHWALKDTFVSGEGALFVLWPNGNFSSLMGHFSRAAVLFFFWGGGGYSSIYSCVVFFQSASVFFGSILSIIVFWLYIKCAIIKTQIVLWLQHFRFVSIFTGVVLVFIIILLVYFSSLLPYFTINFIGCQWHTPPFCVVSLNLIALTPL